MMHSVDGLHNRDIRVEDGEIKLEAVQATVPIGSVDTLLSLPPYEDGTYETENGLIIDLEQFISNMAFPPKYAKSLKRASPTTDSDSELSDRMIQFNKHLVDKLEGDVRW